MNGDLLHNAAELYKAGNKQGAAELLERYLQKNPDDADAWYGLALCATDPVETRTYLIKTLEANPEHPKASQAFEKLEASKEEKFEPDAYLTDYDVPESVVEDYEDEKPEANRRSVLFPIFSSIVIVVLIGTVIWLWYRLDKVEISLIEAESDISSLNSTIVTIDYNIGVLDSDITRIDGNNSLLNSRISGLASDLSYVGSIADNANRFAHSHTYSDARLKENTEQIQDPSIKLAQLQGVYFNWTGAAQDKFGLGANTEIGLIAQEVAQVFPEIVTLDENGYLMVDYSRLVPVLIEAINEQQIEINGLREILQRLEGFDG